MEITSNKKLPSWMDYKIKNGVLSLYGTPQFYDVGKLNILIISKQGMIVRSQNIEIKPKNPLGKINIFEESQINNPIESEKIKMINNESV